MLRMAYDEDLAHRIRELIAGDPDIIEQRMFGGLAFLVAGNMSGQRAPSDHPDR